MIKRTAFLGVLLAALGLSGGLALAASELPSINLAEDVFPTVVSSNEGATRLYVGNDGSGDSVLCVDAQTGQTLWSYAADAHSDGGPIFPRGILPALIGSHLFVMNWYHPSLVVLDSTDGTLADSYEFSEEAMHMTHGFVDGEAILMVTTLSSVHYFREEPFIFLREDALPGTSPQKTAFDPGSSTLFIPLLEVDLVVAHALNWNGGSLSVSPLQAGTGDMPTACVPDANGSTVGVVSIADGMIFLYDKQTLTFQGAYGGLFSVADAAYKDGKLIVLSYHDPDAGDVYKGDILSFDFLTCQSTSSGLPDRYPLTIEPTDIPGCVWAVDRGIYIGGGEIGDGALLQVDTTSAQVTEIHMLSGQNLFTHYDAVTQKLFVSDPPTHSIRVFQLP
ncbi:hypothetical protein J7J84_07695 [bacterium]|nr:hypothetical protein [bacterium]